MIGVKALFISSEYAIDDVEAKLADKQRDSSAGASVLRISVGPIGIGDLGPPLRTT